MKDINQICDYVIFRLTGEGNSSLSHLKLQKLLYYIQAWYMVFEDGNRLFDGKFQAWIHGPVNREVYNRFKDTKFMYSTISVKDIKNHDLSFKDLKELEKDNINAILEAYAPFSDVQLEKMTHEESPWIEARDGYEPFERCEVEINEKTMLACYSARISES